MNAINHHRWLITALVLVPVVLPETCLACATCFGKSDSRLAQGMNMGIFTLLAIVMVMWVGFAAFFIFIARRSRRLQQESGGTTVNPTAATEP